MPYEDTAGASLACKRMMARRVSSRILEFAGKRCLLNSVIQGGRRTAPKEKPASMPFTG